MCICTNFYKATIFKAGFVSNIFYTIFSIALLILCGIQYNIINIKWAKLNIFQCLGDLEISYIVLISLCSIFGYFVFISSLECKTLELIYLIYGSIVFIFSIIVVIWCFLGSPDFINESSQCELIKYKGLLNGFEKFDKLFINVDKALCSNNCKCINDENSVFNFKKCEENLIGDTFKTTFENKDIKNFERGKFMSFWSMIEKKFDCTGLCEVEYSVGNENKKIDKYLFSDINRGKIENYGCIFIMSKWIKRIVISFGSLAVANSLLNLFCIFMDFALYFDFVFEGSNIPKFYPKKISDKDISNKVDFNRKRKKVPITSDSKNYGNSSNGTK